MLWIVFTGSTFYQSIPIKALDRDDVRVLNQKQKSHGMLQAPASPTPSLALARRVSQHRPGRPRGDLHNCHSQQNFCCPVTINKYAKCILNQPTILTQSLKKADAIHWPGVGAGTSLVTLRWGDPVCEGFQSSRSSFLRNVKSGEDVKTFCLSTKKLLQFWSFTASFTLPLWLCISCQVSMSWRCQRQGGNFPTQPAGYRCPQGTFPYCVRGHTHCTAAQQHCRFQCMWT